ncbi:MULTISPECIES: class I SAM-dependent methyltransferase [Shouchella]|uniref:Class I SAM-dependent methyltransferase n=2 Tax=Shouchella TaxID=2893057 RepID=A0ABY7WDQ5_9BACI|nr:MULTISPECIES: class I SAM-dependent methyltransferase [Shouchella]MED4128727.1 class I SAM-dependent methyltransferase [Shouchella miscanthi]WDF05759.1 class I SAM-dependent methyltransferase [Shouchella hunanensis]GAF20500.1 ubiquinone/menaquinone biosynthesis methyltransferase UbiE [Bacillus sp. JCM 19047]
MKQNKYDEPNFYEAYKRMPRSVEGLKGAGEWHVLKTLVPNLANTNVLDLGCGFGWHSRYFHDLGANQVIGIDLSEKMIQTAREMTNQEGIDFRQGAIEDIEFKAGSFDVIFSSLALHYVKSYQEVVRNVKQLLAPKGVFLFSVEHPIFTARAEQDWIYDSKGNIDHWPIDDYQAESIRQTSFLTDHVVKYHRTLTTYLNTLLEAGFLIERIEEPKPDPAILAQNPEYKQELRRPMFLIIKAKVR